MKRVVNFLTLFTSFSTLICCALPALFVALGAGGVLVTLFGQFPELIWLSTKKMWIFSFAGIMLTIGGFLQYNARNEPCPIDQNLAEACSRSRKWSLYIYIFSAVVYLTGAFFAFIAPKIL